MTAVPRTRAVFRCRRRCASRRRRFWATNTTAKRPTSNSTSSTSSGKSVAHGRGDRIFRQPRAPPAAVRHAESAGARHEPPILARAPAPELGNWQLIAGVGHSTYNGAGREGHPPDVERVLWSGVLYLVEVYGQRQRASQRRDEQLKPQQGDCWECENGRSVFDVRHRVTTSFLYELPFGTGRKYLVAGRCARRHRGGWQLGGMMRASSGFPLTVTSGVDRSNTAHGYDRPSAVAGVSTEPGRPQPAAWFNVSAYQMPPLGTFGNLGRATLTGPGVFTIDFSALKNSSLAAASTSSFGSKRSTC